MWEICGSNFLMSDLIIIILNSWVNWAEICDNLNTLNIQTSKATGQQYQSHRELGGGRAEGCARTPPQAPA